MKFSIVIPTFQRSGLLRETLDSLHRQTEQDFEVVVVCDGNDPATRTLAAHYLATYRLKWIFNEANKGQASARNDGAFAAEGELLVFLDDDTTPIGEWLALHRRHHQERGYERVVMVYGKIIETYDRPPRTPIESFLRLQRNQYLNASEHCYRSMNMDLGHFVCFGLNGSISRRAFLAANGFDSNLRSFNEDMELGYRLYDRGVPFVYEPNAIVFHRSTKDLRDSFRTQLRLMGESDVYRARDRGQRNSQTARLAAIHWGNLRRLLLNRFCWNHAEFSATLTRWCERAADATTSELLFALWSRLNRSLYWEGVRAQELDLSSLHRLIGFPLPVLMFHSVSWLSNPKSDLYRLAPTRFSRWLRLARNLGYRSSTPNEFLLGLGRRSVLLTFDDGYEEIYQHAFPVLQETGFRATVFVVTDLIGQTNVWDEEHGLPRRRLLSAEQIKEMHRHGIQFGSHSRTHARLNGLPEAALGTEVADSKRYLEDLLGTNVSSFSYPWGETGLRVRAAVAEAGYQTAFTTADGLNFWNDPLTLRRVNIGGKDTFADFVLKLATGKDYRQRLGNKARELVSNLNRHVT